MNKKTQIKKTDQYNQQEKHQISELCRIIKAKIAK